MKKNIKIKEEFVSRVVESGKKKSEDIFAIAKAMGIKKAIAKYTWENFITYGVVDRTLRYKKEIQKPKLTKVSEDKMIAAHRGRPFANTQEAASFILYNMDHIGKGVLADLCVKTGISLYCYYDAIKSINSDGTLFGSRILKYGKNVKPARITDAIIAYKNKYGERVRTVKDSNANNIARRNLIKRIGKDQYLVSLAAAGDMHNALEKIAKKYDLFNNK